MRSQQIIEWGKPLQERSYDDPVPQGTEVLLKVIACGVCHSDLHIWDGFFDLGGDQRITLEQRGVKTPFTMGHEPVGEVIAMGPDAQGVSIGDKRVVYPWIGCGDCADCKAGDELLCVNPVTIGTRRAGGYSDRVVCPHPRYLVDYEGVPAPLACTYACSGITAYSALKKALPLTKKDSLVIIGAGGVGLSGVHIAPAMSDAKVIVADVDPTKRSAARQIGADETIDNAEPDAVAKVLEMTGGGALAAIDFVGRPETAKFGLDVLKKGGTLVNVGLYGGAMPLSTILMPLKVLTMKGSYVGTLEDLKELMALVQEGKVPPIPIETRPLDAATSALDDLRAGGVLGRVVLTP
ncbi:MAG: alcohol dehydrogenase [Alphaproteobacteria bacterium]